MNLKIKNLLINLLIIISIELIVITPVIALTQDFQWNGSTGYFVKATFTYDEKTATKIISERGAGSTNQLQSLVVTFYSPTGDTIHQYENVIDGESKANYFEFNFDTTTQKPFGNLDLGGELSEEIFLKGTIDEQLSLIEIDPSGKELILDRDTASASDLKE